jgi:hypothetical protein
MKTLHVVRLIGVALLLGTSVACARLGLDFWDRGSDASAARPVQESAVAAAPESVDREALLRRAVQAYIQQTSGDQNRLIRRRPYYYKEYSVYPGGAESAELNITETDSQLTPYIATVRLEKQRYATRLHRDRDEAVADTNFIRDTGTQTLHYEWRGNRWVPGDSLFVAQVSEEQVNGQWTPRDETAERTVAAEEEQAEGGILNRVWSLIGGR